MTERFDDSASEFEDYYDDEFEDIDDEPCHECDGSGSIDVSDGPELDEAPNWQICQTCKGEGTIPKK